MERLSPLRLGREVIERLGLPGTLAVREARLVIGATEVGLQLDVLVTPKVAEALGGALRAAIQSSQPVFSRADCIYTYCPTPENCREKCQYQATRD